MARTVDAHAGQGAAPAAPAGWRTLGGGALAREAEQLVARYLVRRVSSLARLARDRAAVGDVRQLVRHLVPPAIGVGPSSGPAVDKRSECPF